MVDVSIGTAPSLKRCSGPFGDDDGTVRDEKRLKRPDDGSLGRISHAGIAAEIQRAATQGTSTLMKKLPHHFSMAVSVPSLLVQTYWLCRMQVDERADSSLGDAGRQVISRLALWLQPLISEIRHDVVVRFLEKTLTQMVLAYLQALRSASCQQPPIFFTNDFGLEQSFDPNEHSESVEEGEGVLRPGDQCLVVFPALVVQDPKTQSRLPLSNRYVLKVEPPGCLEDLLRDAEIPENERQLPAGGASSNESHNTNVGHESLLSGPGE